MQDYLHNRTIIYTDLRGDIQNRQVISVVPQDSVLGSLLWNITYDQVLSTRVPVGTTITCYADDKLVTVPNTPIALNKNNTPIPIKDTIKYLGLTMDNR